MFKTGSLSSRHYTLTIILLKYSCKLHSLHRYIVVYANLPVRLAVDYAPDTFPATCDTTAYVEALG